MKTLWPLQVALVVLLLFATTAASIAQELIFTPLTPCRLFDTRPSEGGGGILTNGAIRIFSVAGTPGAPGNLAAQGGEAAGCNVPDPVTGSVAAVVVNLAATQAAGPGNIGSRAHDPADAAGNNFPPVSFLNFGQIGGLGALANMVVLPVCTPTTVPPDGCSQGEALDIRASINDVNLIGDVVGYFGPPAAMVAATALEATALAAPSLECIASFNHQIIPSGHTFSLLSPACDMTETLTAPLYEILDATGLPLTHTTDVEMNWPVPDPDGTNAMLCQGTNQSGITVQVGCGANCCRTRGN